MIALSTRPDPSGFWFCVSAPAGSRFDLEYVVIGVGGHHSSGEMSGRVHEQEEWRHLETGFPVIRVGLTAARVVPPSAVDPVPPVPRPRMPRPPQVRDDQPAEHRPARRTDSISALDPTQVLHEVFPQDQLPSVWPLASSPKDDPYPYPYPYPHPYPRRYPTPRPIR